MSRLARPVREHLFQRLARSFWHGEPEARSWTPAVDIRETEGAYVLTMELPGLSMDDVEVSLQNDVLTISGQRRFEAAVKDETYQRIERSYGTFTRAFSMPRGTKLEGTDASFAGGILEIYVPKAHAAEGESNRIDILYDQSRNDLTEEEARVLARGGFDLGPRGEDPVERTAAEYSELVQTSLSTREAARRLGVDDSRIRQRLGEGSLYGLRPGNRWILPDFQFDEKGELPGLATVLAALDLDLHPLAVRRWFVEPHSDLIDRDSDRCLSVRDWLRSGHSPETAARLAADL